MANPLINSGDAVLVVYIATGFSRSRYTREFKICESCKADAISLLCRKCLFSSIFPYVKNVQTL